MAPIPYAGQGPAQPAAPQPPRAPLGLSQRCPVQAAVDLGVPKAALREPQGRCGTCDSSALTPFGLSLVSPVSPVLSMCPGMFLTVCPLRALLGRERGPPVSTVYRSEHHPAHRQALTSNGEACPCLFACSQQEWCPVCLIVSIPSKYLGHTCELTVPLYPCLSQASGTLQRSLCDIPLALLELVQSHFCSLCRHQCGLRNPCLLRAAAQPCPSPACSGC